MIFLDCTLRDGGYYNSWDFSTELMSAYFDAMVSVGVDIVEVGFRSLKNTGFRGPCAYTTDGFLQSLAIPKGISIGVMINASELVGDSPQPDVLQKLFPVPASESLVKFVRIASHINEVSASLPAVNWLVERGYKVGFNLMQIAGRTEAEIKGLAREAEQYPLDVLYFADSMGSMNSDDVVQIAKWLRAGWSGELGIHTHDNMGLALSNTLCAIKDDIAWVDSTVTGMGRGAGNARTEDLAIEIAEQRGKDANLVSLMALLNNHFKPMMDMYGWGSNPYYYLAGKYGIHPTYIQEMLGDPRYDEEDILTVIGHLRNNIDSQQFNMNMLDGARHFYVGSPKGSWCPAEVMVARDVLLLGSGPGVERHCKAIEDYVHRKKPVVIALNTQSGISSDLIDMRAACHPVRILADVETYADLSQPLIVPASMLPKEVRQSLCETQLLDYGLSVQADSFAFHETYATLPTSLVVAYALAVATSGKASRILLAGFDGYGADDPRSQEMQTLFECYSGTSNALPLLAVTPTGYGQHTESIYAL